MSMSESEAIEVFKELLDVPCEMLVKYASVTTEEQKKALVRVRGAEEMAISALEEVQKIKKLGDCYIIPKNGTWEANGIDIHKALEEIQQYRAIGTVSEFRELKEKATAKESYGIKCPHCNFYTINGRYCCNCGKMLVAKSEGKE